MSTSPPIQYSGPVISPEVPWETRRHLQLLYQKLGNHTQAFEQVAQQISTIKVGSGSTTIIEGGGGGSSPVPPPSSSGFLGQGLINDQTGQTAYTTAQGDNGILLVLNDASPVAVTLTAAAAPFYLIITNFGAGIVTLTPSTGTVNGGASLSLLQNETIYCVCNSTDWFTTSQIPVATTSLFGVVKPDGTTITIAGGVISAVGGGSGPTMTQNANGTCANYGNGYLHQFGTAGPSATGVARTSFFVTFPVTFANVPVVNCQPNNDPDAYGTSVFSCYPSNISVFGFTCNLTCGVTIGGGGPANITVPTYVSWFADYF